MSSLMRFNSSVSTLMNDLLQNMQSVEKREFKPAVDITEDSNNYYLYMDLPGMEKKEVSLLAEEGVLTISGEKKGAVRETEVKERYHYTERGEGAFKRSFKIPQGVKSDTIKATMKNGVLAITLEKNEDQIARQISVD